MEASDQSLEPNWLCHPCKIQNGDGSSVLGSIRKEDVMFSEDLEDAYFHVRVHPNSQPYFWITFEGEVDQFKALWFGLSLVRGSRWCQRGVTGEGFSSFLIE